VSANIYLEALLELFRGCGYRHCKVTIPQKPMNGICVCAERVRELKERLMDAARPYHERDHQFMAMQGDAYTCGLCAKPKLGHGGE
jgi:hypothetical protein